jgi:hypothetical protein
MVAGRHLARTGCIGWQGNFFNAPAIHIAGVGDGGWKPHLTKAASLERHLARMGCSGLQGRFFNRQLEGD